MTTIIFELLKSNSDTFPDEFKQMHSGPWGASRIGPHASVVQVETPPEEVKQKLRNYPHRYAMSANEVWRLFPELRHLFHASIERCRIDGWHQLRVPLLECVPGDLLTSDELLFNLSGSRLPEEPGFNCSAVVAPRTWRCAPCTPYESRCLARP